jgi:hypothetical protein
MEVLKEVYVNFELACGGGAKKHVKKKAPKRSIYIKIYRWEFKVLVGVFSAGGGGLER